jgi:hypothetical protein
MRNREIEKITENMKNYQKSDENINENACVHALKRQN